MIEAAASNRISISYLSNEENESTVTGNFVEGGIEVQAVDFFEQVGSQPIDLLKIDIEGGEYDILRDPRFAGLQVGTIVLEWHDCQDVPDGRQWCEDHLTSLGFRTVAGELQYAHAGVLWAWKP